jgi:hypothetical protein
MPVQVGEIDGIITPRLKKFQKLFKSAGIHVKIMTNIDAHLKNHSAGLLPIVHALYRENGDLKKLAANKVLMKLTVKAMKENSQVLRVLGVPTDSLRWIPSIFLVFLFSKLCKMHIAEIGLRGHAMSPWGREEMKNLTGEFQKLIIKSQIPTPAFTKLLEY